MKVRNKHTGEIATLTLSSNGEELLLMKNNEMVTRNVKLSDLEEWEDYEEPNVYWRIDCDGEIEYDGYEGTSFDKDCKAIGNYFSSREEAELAVRKLKAWKRLKSHDLFISKGNRTFVNTDDVFVVQNVQFRIDTYGDVGEDLDLIFGGEE